MKIDFTYIKNLWSDVKDVTITTISKAIEDDIMTQGAAIAFYMVFSVAPLFVLIVTLAGVFLTEDYVTNQVELYLAGLVGTEIASNLNQYLQDISYSTSGFFTTIIAAVTVVFGATTVFTQLKFTLNRIWKVEEVHISSVWSFLLNRLMSFGVIILMSTLLIASLLAEAIIGFVSGIFSPALLSIDLDLYKIISELVTLSFAVLFFTLIFKVLPDVNAPWKDMIIGAIATTLLFLLGKYLIGLYFSASGINAAYRAAGSLIIFVVWVYYNIQTILLGAVFTQVYTEKYGGVVQPYRYVSLKSTIRHD